MSGYDTNIQDNFYLINGVIGILFLFIYGFFLLSLITHMRQMVRLKYHVDQRAEFDESRVKILIAIIFFLVSLYVGVWVFCLLTLDISSYTDYQLASSLFKATSACLLIGAYAIFFINNRIKGDIEHIKKTVRTSSEDKSQRVLVHL